MASERPGTSYSRLAWDSLVDGTVTECWCAGSRDPGCFSTQSIISWRITEKRSRKAHTRKAHPGANHPRWICAWAWLDPHSTELGRPPPRSSLLHAHSRRPTGYVPNLASSQVHRCTSTLRAVRRTLIKQSRASARHRYVCNSTTSRWAQCCYGATCTPLTRCVPGPRSLCGCWSFPCAALHDLTQCTPHTFPHTAFICASTSSLVRGLRRP